MAVAVHSIIWFCWGGFGEPPVSKNRYLVRDGRGGEG